MNSSTPLAALAGAVVAGAAVFFVMQAPATKAPTAATSIVTLAPGTPVSGELTSASQLNYSNGVRSELFTINAEAGQIIRLNASGALRGQIAVFQDGQLLASSKESCNSCGRRNADTSVTFKAPTKGAYLVVVSGRDAQAYGPFRLNASLQQAYDGKPLSGNQRISDWALGEVQRYTIELEQDGLYRFDMLATQSDLDPYLVLQDNLGNELATDDDGGDNLNARIQLPLVAGSYTLIADSALDTASDFQGSYDIQVQLINALDRNRLENGAALDLSGPPASGRYDGSPITATFGLEAPTLVTLTLTTAGEGGSLSLTGENVSLRQDDDGVKTLRSVLPAGQYTVALEGSRSGELFVLEPSAKAAPAGAGGGSLTIGEQRQGLLLSGLEYDTYFFTVTRPMNYVIDMKSPALDTYLWLYRDGELIAEDDDSGGNLNAQLTMTLEPGDYELRAGQWGGTSNRDYRYTLTVNPAGNSRNNSGA